MTSLVQGFSKSLAMTVLSEIGDKTFFAAAILAMRHPRRLVLSGCLAALIVMTILSAIVGWAAPNLISRKLAHLITTSLFFGFGLWSLWDALSDGGEAEELAEVEKKLEADWQANAEAAKEGKKVYYSRRPKCASPTPSTDPPASSIGDQPLDLDLPIALRKGITKMH